MLGTNLPALEPDISFELLPFGKEAFEFCFSVKKEALGPHICARWPWDECYQRHLVAWIGGVDALSPTRVPGHAVRTYSGRPRSSIRFSTSAAIATSIASRPSVWKRRPSPTTRFHREISHSARARQPYPRAL